MYPKYPPPTRTIINIIFTTRERRLIKENNFIFRGTHVASGLAIARITAIGNETKLGAIGKSLESIQEEKTPLEKQISNFVKKMIFVGAIVISDAIGECQMETDVGRW